MQSDTSTVVVLDHQYKNLYAINCIPIQGLASHLISQLYMQAFLLAVTFYTLR